MVNHSPFFASWMKQLVSPHDRRSAGTGSSGLSSFRFLIQAFMLRMAHSLLNLVFVGTTPFAASRRSGLVTGFEKRLLLLFFLQA